MSLIEVLAEKHKQINTNKKNEKAEAWISTPRYTMLFVKLSTENYKFLFIDRQIDTLYESCWTT